MVELSVQVMLVPVCARVSKFSVSGEPRVVILPPFVRAEDGRTRAVMPNPMQTITTRTEKAINRNLVRDRGMDLDIRLSSRCVGGVQVLMEQSGRKKS